MSIYQGLCSNSGKLQALWKGEPGDDRLFFSQFDGSKWAGAVTIGGNSSVGPALAVFNGAVFGAWKGEPNDERLFYAKLSGSTWGPQAQIPGAASSVGPSLAALSGKLFGAWKNSGGDQSIGYASFDGSSWSAQANIPGVASSEGPSLAAFGSVLYAAWKGEGIDQGLYFASFDGAKWSAQARIPGAASSVGPSLAAFEGKLYAIWKGQAIDQSLYCASFDGSKWSAQTQIPGVASSIGAALSVYNGKLYAMWKGSGTDVSLYNASFDGTKWSAQANDIPGNTGPDTPKNVGVKMQYQETDEWCWIAVATSIGHYYDSASTTTQCSVMTTVGQTINHFPADTSASPDKAVLAAHPGLSGILADPYTTAALYVLDNLITSEYVKSGGVGDPLKLNGNCANYPGQSSLTLAQIWTELGAGRPVAADIAWNGGGQHCVAIAGVVDDQLLICDPIYGDSIIQYEQFPANYHGGATLNAACLTKKA